MLIATTIGAEGQPKVLIGISRKIIDHLLSGQPATMKTKSVEVMLLFAETDQDLHLLLAREGLIGPSTQVTLD
jgi:hypothetical protein